MAGGGAKLEQEQRCSAHAASEAGGGQAGGAWQGGGPGRDPLQERRQLRVSTPVRRRRACSTTAAGESHLTPYPSSLCRGACMALMRSEDPLGAHLIAPTTTHSLTPSYARVHRWERMRGDRIVRLRGTAPHPRRGWSSSPCRRSSSPACAACPRPNSAAPRRSSVGWTTACCAVVRASTVSHCVCLPQPSFSLCLATPHTHSVPFTVCSLSQST